MRARGSPASSTSVMSRSEARSTSVTKSRLPLTAHASGSAGRSTSRTKRAARVAADLARSSKSNEDSILLRSPRVGTLGDAAYLFRNLAVGRTPHRQLPRRGPELGPAAGFLRLPLRDRRSARHHGEV